MQALKQVCEGYGVRLIVIVPAASDVNDKSNTVAAGRRTGVLVVIPYADGEMSANRFWMASILSPDGAKLFTSRLCDQLLSMELYGVRSASAGWRREAR